jgi:hypothetical protein
MFQLISFALSFYSFMILLFLRLLDFWSFDPPRGYVSLLIINLILLIYLELGLYLLSYVGHQ